MFRPYLIRAYNMSEPLRIVWDSAMSNAKWYAHLLRSGEGVVRVIAVELADVASALECFVEKEAAPPGRREG